MCARARVSRASSCSSAAHTLHLTCHAERLRQVRSSGRLSHPSLTTPTAPHTHKSNPTRVGAKKGQAVLQAEAHGCWKRQQTTCGGRLTPADGRRWSWCDPWVPVTGGGRLVSGAQQCSELNMGSGRAATDLLPWVSAQHGCLIAAGAGLHEYQLRHTTYIRLDLWTVYDSAALPQESDRPLLPNVGVWQMWQICKWGSW